MGLPLISILSNSSLSPVRLGVEFVLPLSQQEQQQVLFPFYFPKMEKLSSPSPKKGFKMNDKWWIIIEFPGASLGGLPIFGAFQGNLRCRTFCEILSLYGTDVFISENLCSLSQWKQCWNYEKESIVTLLHEGCLAQVDEYQYVGRQYYLAHDTHSVIKMNAFLT